MNQAGAERRLEALEAQAREAELERAFNDPEMRSLIETYAREAGVSVDLFVQESMEISRRIAEVGEEVWVSEVAARFGMTVEEYRAGTTEEAQAKYREWVEAGSIPGAWRTS